MGTRPDTAVATGSLARYLHNPGQIHWEAAGLVLCYLKGIRGWRLKLHDNQLQSGVTRTRFRTCQEPGVPTYPNLCLPVITGDVANQIGVLLQANIRKAGTVGTPSVPRTTASSTIGTVIRAGSRRPSCHPLVI